MPGCPDAPRLLAHPISLAHPHPRDYSCLHSGGLTATGEGDGCEMGARWAGEGADGHAKIK